VKGQEKMISVIVFSKDRPMQMHAYLESLEHFSGIDMENLSVIYNESENISYEKVISNFPLVKWIKEEYFVDQLGKSINCAGKYIMFGCDDVVFTSDIDLSAIERALNNNIDVFGYSLRLGENIKPLPSNIELTGQNFQWKWKETDAPHYNYPFELDCTVYRKEDILEIYTRNREKCTNPNRFEGVIYNDDIYEIKRPYLMMGRGRSRAVVITVNRVQDTCLNEVDDSMGYSVEYLQELYNRGRRFDIMKIAGLSTNSIHVDSTFIYFTKTLNSTIYVRRIIKYIKNFVHNIAYLFRHNIAKEQIKMKNEIINHMRDE